MHLGSGAPKTHTEEQHNMALTREIMVNNTKIIRREDDPRRLKIYEALLIQQKQPSINNQETGYAQTLKLYSNGSHSQVIRQQPGPSSSYGQRLAQSTSSSQSSASSTNQPPNRRSLPPPVSIIRQQPELSANSPTQPAGHINRHPSDFPAASAPNILRPHPSSSPASPSSPSSSSTISSLSTSSSSSSSINSMSSSP